MTFIKEEKKLMLELDEIVPCSYNPRESFEFELSDKNFKLLVDSLKTDRINTQAINVYRDNGQWHQTTGHRRVAALKQINKLDHAEWVAKNDNSPEPEYIKFVYATEIPKPENEIEQRLSMLTEENSKTKWSIDQKFKFFSDTYDLLSKETREDPKKIQSVFAITYLEFSRFMVLIRVPSLRSFVIKNIKEKTLSKNGVVDIMCEINHLAFSLHKNRSKIFSSMTTDELCLKLIDKAKDLSKKHQLKKINIGPATAIRNFKKIVAVNKDYNDMKVYEWVCGKDDDLDRVINVTASSKDRFGEEDPKLIEARLNYKKPRNKSREQAIKDADTYQVIADFYSDCAKSERKYISNISQK
tara:strand:- start:1463 stop:2530 length:1068 start_codon:yes stop_codon:yes gene_type:complete